MTTEAIELKPCRIQRKRTKGWKMPPNTVYVGRGSKLGNPFKVGRDGSLKECLEQYAYWLNGLVRAPVAGANMRGLIASIRGKNLACWCPLNQPCHADALLEIANV